MRAAALLLVLAGCGTDGGVLELDVTLPAAGALCSAESASMHVVFERDVGGMGACPFAADWAAGDCIADLALDAAPRGETISIVAGPDDVEEPLCVRIAFGSGGCLVGATPTGTATLRVDPAFEDGRYTALAVTVASPCADEDLGTRGAMPAP